MEGWMNGSYPGPHKMNRYRPLPWVCPVPPQSMPRPLYSPATAWHVQVAGPLTTLTYAEQCASLRQLPAQSPAWQELGRGPGTRECLLNEQGVNDE